MPEPPIACLRALCLALPEATDKEAWGDPTFRVRDRIFAVEKRGRWAHLAMVPQQPEIHTKATPCLAPDATRSRMVEKARDSSGRGGGFPP
jgi:hypothetical protein